jgi:UDP-glucose 4-epimerase
MFKYKYGILRYFNVAGASNSEKIGEIENSHGHLIKNIAIQSLKKNQLLISLAMIIPPWMVLASETIYMFQI